MDQIHSDSNRWVESEGKLAHAGAYAILEGALECPLSDFARGFIAGLFSGRLESPDKLARRRNAKLAKAAMVMADAIEADSDNHDLPWVGELTSRLRQYAARRQPLGRGPGRRTLEYKDYIIEIAAEVYDAAGGRVAVGGNGGPFARFLAAVWEALDRQERCKTAETFVARARDHTRKNKGLPKLRDHVKGQRVKIEKNLASFLLEIFSSLRDHAKGRKQH